jgi:hypothetical protein
MSATEAFWEFLEIRAAKRTVSHIGSFQNGFPPLYDD